MAWAEASHALSSRGHRRTEYWRFDPGVVLVNVLDLSRLPGVLRTHWRLVLGTPLLLAALVVAGYGLLTPTYRASAAIIIDGRGVEKLVDTERDANPTPASVISTGIDVIRSDGVLNRAIADLGLIDGRTPATPAARALAAERREAWMKATKGQVDQAAWLLRWLGKALSVQPASLNSNVVSLQVDYADADGAAALANAIAQAYLAVALDVSLAPTRQTASFFEAQIGQTRAALAEAQAARSRFQQANGLMSVNEAADLENALMAEMAVAATQARARGADAAARSGTAASNPTEAPEVMQAAVVQQLSSDIARQKAQMAELSSRLGGRHPQVIAHQQQIDDLEQRLKDAAAQVARSVELGAQAANGNDRAVQGLLQRQRERVMGLKKAREELAVLQQNVDMAQRAYDQALQRHTQASNRNDSLLSDARVLAPAAAPLDPTRPPLPLALVFGLLAGGLLGAALAFVAEQRRPRLRLPEDLSQVLGLPVLASLPPLPLAPPQAGLARWLAPLRAARGAA